MLRARLECASLRPVYLLPFSLSGWLRLPMALIDRLFGRHAYRERTLVVVRHASAERQRPGESDRERALTEAGRIDAERLGAMLFERGLAPDVVLTSPARRATETTSHLAAAGGLRSGARVEQRLYQASVDDVLAVVSTVPDSVRSVLVVAHDPALSELVGMLTGEHESLPAGGMAMLRATARDWSEIGRNGARTSLVGLWRPASPATADGGARADGDNAALQVDPIAPTMGPPSRSSLKWLAASADETVAEVAARALEDRFSTLASAAAEFGANTVEPDALRRLRVAGRRAEATLKTFRELLPRKRSERLRKRLRALRRATRRTRDEQVLTARLESQASEPCAATVLSVLRSRCGETSAGLDASIFTRVAELVVALRARAAPGANGERFGDWALRRHSESLARYRARQALATPDAPSVESLHELRLAGKRLRYEIELLAAVLPSDVKAIAYPALVAKQDLLGVVSDQAAAVARLGEVVSELDASHPHEDLAALVFAERMRLDEARADAVARLRTEK